MVVVGDRHDVEGGYISRIDEVILHGPRSIGQARMTVKVAPEDPWSIESDEHGIAFTNEPVFRDCAHPYDSGLPDNRFKGLPPPIGWDEYHGFHQLEFSVRRRTDERNLALERISRVCVEVQCRDGDPKRPSRSNYTG